MKQQSAPQQHSQNQESDSDSDSNMDVSDAVFFTRKYKRFGSEIINRGSVTTLGGPQS